MNIIAEFEKVSIGEYASSLGMTIEQAQPLYDTITLPEQSTIDSAGHDFITPTEIVIAPGETVKVATGIRASINHGWFLGMFPRSGHGFKYRLQLDNTVGIIDGDYYFSDNEGHIFVKITNDSKDPNNVLTIPAGGAFCQGIFMMYGVAVNSNPTDIRNGGEGSTDKK